MAVNTVCGLALQANRLGRRARRGMAPAAAVVVGRDIQLAGRLVRIVAGEAGERSAALSGAGALGQIDRLMAHVPGVAPIDGHAFRGRRAMTLAAQFVYLRRGQRGWIPDVIPLRIARMSGAAAMARFTADALLRDGNFTVLSERDRSRGM